VPEDNRVPLFMRILPDLKVKAAEAAWREHVSLARFVEEAVRDRLRGRETEPAAE
jgi:hypothetical protein